MSVRWGREQARADMLSRQLGRAGARIAEMKALFERALKEVIPVAADCPRPNSNVINYTDKEWERVVAFTEATRYLLNKLKEKS